LNINQRLNAAGFKENIMQVNFENFSKTFEPKKLSDFVFGGVKDQEFLESLVNNMLEFPGGGRNGILLYGPPGTGKTTLARMLPSLVEQARYQRDATEYLFIPCFGEDKTEEKIISLATRYLNLGSDAYFYRILDEVDSLTPAAMKALKSVLDTGTDSALYIFTTNDISKVSDAVRDRCYEINMVASASEWVPIVRKILDAYNVKAFTDAQIVTQISALLGSARKIQEKAKDLVQHYYNANPNLVPPVLPCV
jgi:replication-associated recombination protein RarA